MEPNNIVKEKDDLKELFKRTNALAEESASTRADVRHLSDTLNTFMSHVDTSFSKLTTKIDNISAGAKTNWGVLASWASVIIAVMIYHSNITIAPLYKSIHEHSLLDGHPTALVEHAKHTERIKALEKSVLSLDTVLQREMRDLDVILQREIQLEARVLDERIRSLEKHMTVRAEDRYPRKEAENINKHFEQRLRKVEDHSDILGHPHLQTHELNTLHERLELIDQEQRRRTNKVYE